VPDGALDSNLADQVLGNDEGSRRGVSSPTRAAFLWALNCVRARTRRELRPGVSDPLPAVDHPTGRPFQRDAHGGDTQNAVCGVGDRGRRQPLHGAQTLRVWVVVILVFCQPHPPTQRYHMWSSAPSVTVELQTEHMIVAL